jgi:hypothetical protein
MNYCQFIADVPYLSDEQARMECNNNNHGLIESKLRRTDAPYLGIVR